MEFMEGIVQRFLQWVLALLPLSPFTEHIEALGELPYLAYLNWFIPIPTFLKIGTAWLGAIALFYVYSIVLRWVRAID